MELENQRPVAISRPRFLKTTSIHNFLLAVIVSHIAFLLTILFYHLSSLLCRIDRLC